MGLGLAFVACGLWMWLVACDLWLEAACFLLVLQVAGAFNQRCLPPFPFRLNSHYSPQLEHGTRQASSPQPPGCLWFTAHSSELGRLDLRAQRLRPVATPAGARVRLRAPSPEVRGPRWGLGISALPWPLPLAVLGSRSNNRAF